MAGVFISYRREDSPGHAGRIFDRLQARFGADIVFMDVHAMVHVVRDGKNLALPIVFDRQFVLRR